MQSSRGIAADRRDPAPAGWSSSLSVIAAAWALSLGFDVFLHGGLLSPLYFEPGPFLLPPEQAFRRIPLGYLAFLGLTVALYWLFRRLDIRGGLVGAQYGAAAGAMVWGAFVIGLYSISTAGPGLLAGWWAGQTIELGLAGSVIGAARRSVSLKKIWTVVVVAVVVLAAATVALQSLGLAPAMKISR
ncbi:MAG TPA: hypothetical protein VFZ56_02765 [Gemmatimonadaceae bacterium]